MSLYFRVGTTDLDRSEVRLRRVEKHAIIGPRGYFNGRRERWHVSGTVRAASSSALKTAVDARITLLNGSDYDRDVGLYFAASGSSPTSHVLSKTGSANGVVISPLVFSDEGAVQGSMLELIFYRHYQFTIDVEYPDATQGSGLVMYKEQVEYIGTGGADYKIFEYITDPVDSQTTKLYTKLAWRQWGTAVGLLATPTPPSPLATPLPHGYRVTEGTPLKYGRKQSTGYPLSWSYYGEGPLAFTPYVFP